MQDYIQRRVLDVTHYVLESRCTVRQAGEEFGISKSTVHKDLTERLPTLDRKLASRVRKVLDYNASQRHIRGGEVTRKKYSNTK